MAGWCSWGGTQWACNVDKTNRTADRRIRVVSVSLIAIALVGLWLVSRRNYVLFHSVVEVLSVVVGCGVFMVTWHSRRFHRNSFLLLLGMAYLYVAGLDFLHALAYTGMGVFPGYGADLPTQLWLAARYVESLSLLLAVLLLGRRVRSRWVVLGYTVVASLLLASIFWWGIFPACFVDGTGLTAFKTTSEYVICAILVVSIVLLLRKRQEFDPAVLGLLVASMAVTIASELAFTLYVDPYGVANMVGHLLKVISVYLLYLAVVRTGLLNPYDLLFGNLKKGQEALAQSEERYRTLMEQMPDGVCVHDNGRIVFSNESHWRMLGFDSADEIIGADGFDFIAPESQEAVRERIATRLRGEDVPDRYEIRSRRRDGSTFYSEVIARAMKLDGHTVVQVILRDISERKRADRTLQESEERYRSLFEAANDAIFLADPETGTILGANSKAADLLGRPLKEIIGMHQSALHPEGEARHYAAIFRDHVAHGGGAIGNIRVAHSSGRIIPVEINASLVEIAGEKILFGIFRDVSDRRELEAQLVRAQKMESMGTLAGGVAHNFNNLLGAILGNVELAKLRLGDAKDAQQFLDRAAESCDRAARLAQQLLSVSRREPGEKTICVVHSLVDGLCQALGLMLDSNIRIDWEVTDPDCRIDADYTEIEQALMNICLNARDAMPRGGALRITADVAHLPPQFCDIHKDMTPGRHVCICITDTGTCMDKETLARIFDPFFTTKEPGKGTGLGLSTAYGTVVNHGGCVDVESEVGKGTRFRIYLPVAEKSAESEPETAAPDPLKGHETILVVDDEESIRRVTRAGLESLGYTVLLAEDGAKAVEIHQKEREQIDLVLLDYIMPEMDGEETYRRLKQIDPCVRVVAVSGYDEKSKVKPLLDAGVDGFLHKPYHLPELSQALRQVLDGG